jgi:hypothetical protein
MFETCETVFWQSTTMMMTSKDKDHFDVSDDAVTCTIHHFHFTSSCAATPLRTPLPLLATLHYLICISDAAAFVCYSFNPHWHGQPQSTEDDEEVLLTSSRLDERHKNAATSLFSSRTLLVMEQQQQRPTKTKDLNC